ncbi:MAG: DNA polymerase III subunit beta [Clostridia bacterium]|nr:DNA polymerase III subunit beta [Clostridia bacterium]
MKFSCNPDALSDALNIVSKAIPNKPTIPILEGIKLVAQGSTLILSATDMEMFIEKKINADILLEGELVVSGRIFTEFIRKLSDLDSITIEKFAENLNIYYGDNETAIQCLNEDTYPEIRQIDDDSYFMIKEGVLKETIERAIFCVAVEDSRPILKGCLLEIKDNVLTAVALDGYRLAVAKCGVTEQKGDIKIIVPGKHLNEIAKVLGESEEIFKVNIQKNNIMFDLGHTRITARLMEGEFLQYEKIIPVTNQTSIVIHKEEMERGLGRASLIARDMKNNYSKLSISNDMIIIKSNSEVGNFRENVACKQSGKDLEIAFNSRFLFDAFNRIKEDYIKIEFNGSSAPALITPLEGEKFKYIILPVRMIG